MQVCVVGGGLAGSLLAWRLVQRGASVSLVPGWSGIAPTDATAVSGGSVRAYEVDPAQRGLAIAAMAELVSDPRLLQWASYVECGSVYLPQRVDGLSVADIDAVLPGSASIVDAAELRAAGWADLDDAVLGVHERTAGYVSPSGLRSNVLADLAQRRNLRLERGFVDRVGSGRVRLDGRSCEFDVVVLAAGAWTPGLLGASGFDPSGLTTKGIQYTLHTATGGPRTAFVDDRTDLFGRPTPDGLLLGLPTEAWGIGPSVPAPDEALAQRAAALAERRFPGLQLHSASRPATAVDCYAPDHLLSLRPVTDRLFTFSGGSGGSVKTALAASDRAAGLLSAPVLSDPPATLQQPEFERSTL